VNSATANDSLVPISGTYDTEALERAVRRALWRLLPFLTVANVFNYLDRVNVSFAALAMNAELGLTATQFGFGAGLFYAGYVLFQVPSNLGLYRLGARRWLAGIMVVWGLVASAAAFAIGPVSFAILRLLSGAAEAGPGNYSLSVLLVSSAIPGTNPRLLSGGDSIFFRRRWASLRPNPSNSQIFRTIGLAVDVHR
jgi:hypothetical protein